jgi:hypothetical protein
VVGRRRENFGVEKRWKKNIYVGTEDGIFVHPENDLKGLIHNWCIGGCWFILAELKNHKIILVQMVLFPPLTHELQILWQHVLMKNRIYNHKK